METYARSICFREPNIFQILGTQYFFYDRDLKSLIHQPNFAAVRGLVIGRFQLASKMNLTLLDQIIKSKKDLTRMPVIANVDFGHTEPKCSLPIGVMSNY